MKRMIPSSRDAEVIKESTRGEQFKLFLGLVGRDASRTQEFVKGQTNTDGEVRADPAADFLSNVEDNLAAVPYRATIAVGPPVVGGLRN